MKNRARISPPRRGNAPTMAHATRREPSLSQALKGPNLAGPRDGPVDTPEAVRSMRPGHNRLLSPTGAAVSQSDTSGLDTRFFYDLLLINIFFYNLYVFSFL